MHLSLKKSMAITLSVVFFSAIAGWLLLTHAFFDSLRTVFEPNLPQIREITKINFSDDIIIIGCEFESALDCSLLASIEISADELATLFPEDKYMPSKTIRYVKNTFCENNDWFKPDSVSSYKSFFYSDNDSNTGLQVLYEDTGTETRKLYLLWSSSY